MAKLALIFSIIYSLFLLSHARIPLYQLDNSVTDDIPIIPSSLSEVEPKKTSVAIPIDRDEGDSAALHRDEGDSAAIHRDEGDSGTITRVKFYHPLDSSFRPINRHFRHLHVKRPFGLRFRRPCSHHNRVHGPRFAVRELPYGDDMIELSPKIYDVSKTGERKFHFPIKSARSRINGDLLKDEGEKEKKKGGFLAWVKGFTHHLG